MPDAAQELKITSAAARLYEPGSDYNLARWSETNLTSSPASATACYRIRGVAIAGALLAASGVSQPAIEHHRTARSVKTPRTANHVSRISRRSVELLISEALFAIDEAAVEDGITHAAETIFLELHAANPSDALSTFASIVRDGSKPSRSIGALKILGRLSIGGHIWRHVVVESALKSPSVELRDAAIQAVENWGDKRLLEVLRLHEDPVPWLADYTRQVVGDIEAQ